MKNAGRSFASGFVYTFEGGEGLTGRASILVQRRRRASNFSILLYWNNHETEEESNDLGVYKAGPVRESNIPIRVDGMFICSPH